MGGYNIPDGEVRVWWASLDIDHTEVERLRTILSQDELRRADRFRIDGAARRFIAARAALRTVLGKAVGKDPAEVTFAFGERGKPKLPHEGPCFNASDTGDFVAIAVTAAEVGVDIELARPLRRRERLARRICTDRELEALSRLPDEQRAAQLLRLWTCKEAALKAIGTGLPGGVRKVEVEFSATGPTRLVRLLDEADGWTLHLPELSPNLLCSLVVRGRDQQVVSRQFSIHST